MSDPLPRIDAPPDSAGGARLVGEVAARLGSLAARLAPWGETEPPADGSDRDDDDPWAGLARHVARARALLDGKLRWELATACRAPWMVMVAGGTNVGKSQLFNALARREGALPDARGAQTKHPLAYVHRDDAPLLRAGLADSWQPLDYAGPEALNAPHPDDERGRPPLYVLEHDDPAGAGLCLLDAPDIDSNLESNRRKALALIRAVDCVLYVTVTEKYNDRLCVEFLRACAQEGRRVVAVFNLATRANLEAQEHFRDVVLPELFGDRAAEGAAAEVEAVEPVYDKAARHAVLCDRVAGLRARLAADAAARLATKAALVRHQGGLVAAALEEAAALAARVAAWRARAEGDLERRRAEAREEIARAYEPLPFYELDAVFARIYARLEVPYLDRVLQRGSELAWRAALALGLAERKLPTTASLRRQRDDAEDALSATLVGEQRRHLDQLLAAERDEAVASLVRRRRPAEGWLPAEATLFPRTPDDATRLADILDGIEGDLQRLVDERPAVRSALVGARAALMLGGAGAVIFSAGLSTLTVVLGSSAAAVVRNAMEKIGRRTLDTFRARWFGPRAHWAVGELAALQRDALARLDPPADDATAAELAPLVAAWRRLLDSLPAR